MRVPISHHSFPLLPDREQDLKATVESALNWPQLAEHNLPYNGATPVADLLVKLHLHDSEMW